MIRIAIRLAIATVLFAAFTTAPVFAGTIIGAASPEMTSPASTATMPSCAAGDPVVWVNTARHVYHLQGDKYFGKTTHGKYECRSAAVAEGAKPAGMRRHAPRGATSPAPTPSP